MSHYKVTFYFKFILLKN